MITMEQVELLRSKADVTYEEARRVLEATGGDLLDAIVLLETQGKVRPPEAAKRVADETESEPEPQPEPVKTADHTKRSTTQRDRSDGFFHRVGEGIKRVFRYMNRNNFVITRDGREMMTLPITALILLLIFFFWAVLALILIGLFTRFRFSFSGPDIKDDTATSVMDSLADTADALKRDINGSGSSEKKENTDANTREN